MPEKHKELGKANINRLLLKLSFPSMIAMFANAIYNIVDTIFVGRGVGAQGIAGVAIVLPVVAIISSFAHMIGIGTGTLISRQLGRKEEEKVNRTAGNGFLLVILVGAFFSTIGLLFTNEIMRAFGATPTILPYASDYGQIVFIGMLWFPFCVSTSNYLRAEGNARDAMNAMLLGILVNVVLDYIFIFPLQMGMHGAALATISGKFTTLIYLIVYFRQPNHVINFRFRCLRLNKHVLKPALSVGLSGFGMRSSSSVANVVLNHTLGALGGDIAIAVFGVIYKITLFFGMPLYGLNQGMQPIVGFNFGADKPERIKRTIKLGFMYAVGYGILAIIFFQIFAEPIFGLFTKDQNLMQEGPRALRIIISMMWLMGIYQTTMGAHQAMGQPRAAFVLAIQRWVLLVTPLVLILPHVFNLGLDGVWLAFPLADFLGTIIALIFLFVTLRRRNIVR
ncbi:Multidrug export protein MepA [Salinivirga cyanobacteriivorans]|uniref:Multidrug export protein MepA n=1 Tax=Salinivirga cyanobacteriivorans TaxID=1307839 RepID=A0A0S2I416_9BACT|nr:MATE family efflux transporter [Salinivirga cyanobacteriivorans]ALO17040.1 Multidrug export protein MepA [Salinivirga cyanobacteriivorans]